MGDFNTADNVNSTIQFGYDMCDVRTTQLKTGTTAYPGSLLTDDTTVGESKVCTSILPPKGWLVLEDTPLYIRKKRTTDTYDGAFANDDDVAYARSAIGAILKARVAKYSVLINGEFVCNWAGGEVYGPCAPGGNGIWIGVPYAANNNSETSCGTVLPVCVVEDAMIEVTAIDATETMDVGLTTDPNGFLAAIDLATLGITPATVTVTSGTKEVVAASTTYGQHLVDTFTAGVGTTTYDVGTYIRTCYESAGTLPITNTCTAGTTTAVGMVWFSCFHPHLQIVGQAVEAIDASSAATTGLIKSLI